MIQIKKIIGIVLIFTAFLLSGCVENRYYCENGIEVSDPADCAIKTADTNPSDPLPIGGQRDEYGCLTGAGYSYDEYIGACTRSWEILENQKEFAKMAAENTGRAYGLTVIEVILARCPGCAEVKLQKIDGNQINVSINDWKIIEQELTPQECEANGGTSVNIVAGATCEEGQKNIGKVIGFISPNICCVPE